MERIYAAIDLKSFYASVECIYRGLDPMTTNLVVADQSRTDKTICLAVSPALKSFGVPGRPRLFEVVERVRYVNALRQDPRRPFRGSSCHLWALEDQSLKVDYIVAPPRMAAYVQMSSRIVEIYLRHIAPEDLHIYSIDEVFMDLTHYLKCAGLSAQDYVRRIIRDVYHETGITATAGLGPNLFLCKVAMDVVAKKMAPDETGARIATLTEQSYRQLLWGHRPITDIWRVGAGTAKRLADYGMHTMGDVARKSLTDERLLYKLFGVGAELLIDHAWGYEPVTIAHIKAYHPQTKSLSSGQVLHTPYTWQKARLIVEEMIDQLALDLVRQKLMTDQIVLTVNYDRENIGKWDITQTRQDHYGRTVPKHSHGTVHLDRKTSSGRLLMEGVVGLYDRITDRRLTVRKIHISVCRLTPEQWENDQLNLFEDDLQPGLERENRRQQAVLRIKDRFGKNAIMKAISLEEGATAMERNAQIGGHKA